MRHSAAPRDLKVKRRALGFPCLQDLHVFFAGLMLIKH